MARTRKPTQSEIDGVAYRRAKLWQIILYASNALCGLTVYSLIGQASYAASIGFGISTMAVGAILTGTRILDAITDPLLAFLYDRVNTRFGKLRILIMGGFAVEALALLCMFDLCSSKGFGMGMFIALYVLYVLGYTINNMTIQTIPAILSNDPKQRPTIGVWGTVFNYMVPMAFSIVLNMVVLARAGGTFNQVYLSSAVRITLLLGLAGNVGVAAYGVVANFALVATAIFNGVAQGAQPLVSRCYGQNDHAGARKLLLLGSGTVLVLAAVLYGIIFGATDALVGVFNSESSARMAQFAHMGMRLYFVGYFFAGFNIMAAGYLSAVNRPAEASITSICRGMVAIVACSLVLGAVFGMPGVWAAFPASELLTALLTLFLLRRKESENA